MTKRTEVDYEALRERLAIAVNNFRGEIKTTSYDPGNYGINGNHKGVIMKNSTVMAFMTTVQTLVALEDFLAAKAEQERQPVRLPQGVLDFKK